MATILSAAAVNAVSASRAKGRPEAEYAEYVYAAIEAGEPIGNCESDFPEVKPAHVAHMFRKVIKEQNLNDQVTLGKSAEYGVCLLPA
jgi:hypothetical protein